MTPILENERAKLIPFTTEAAQDLKSIIFDDSIWEYMGHYIRTDSDFNIYIEDTLLASKGSNAIPFLIIDKNDNTIAGCTRFGNLDISSKRAEIGWTWYGKKYQGTGLNGAVKKLMLTYGFEVLKLNRIQLGTDTQNLKSQKAIEKLNAVKEGVRRNHYVDSLGICRDDIYYSIIREDWLRQQ